MINPSVKIGERKKESYKLLSEKEKESLNEKINLAINEQTEKFKSSISNKYFNRVKELEKNG